MTCFLLPLRSWNKFDLAVAVISVIDGLLFASGSDDPVVAGLRYGFRIVRVIRGLRLARSVEGIRTVLTTVWSSLPALFNVGVLLFIVYVIFAIVGVNLFGIVRPETRLSCTDPSSPRGHRSIDPFLSCNAAFGERRARGLRELRVLRSCLAASVPVQHRRRVGRDHVPSDRGRVGGRSVDSVHRAHLLHPLHL